MFAQVIVDIVHENVARTFTYRIPEGMRLSPGWRVSVPFGPRTIEGVVLSLTETCDLPPEKIRTVASALEDYPAILPELLELAQRMAEETHAPLAETLRLMLPAQMRGGRVHVKTETVACLTVSPAEAEAAAKAQGRSVKRRTLLTLLTDGEAHPMAELGLLVKDPLPALRQLRDAGLVRIGERELLRRPGGTRGAADADPPLTDEQRQALDDMLPRVRRGEGRFLLYGVTGSGKTEVFIRLVRDCLSRGKGAVILVPEIALTPQMVDWFMGRFGPVAAVLHSRLSPGERFDEWRRIRRGDARVVIGARSAIFAPLHEPGVIIVDEEHETTYLSDRHPRYDARAIAEQRCDREGAALVLASATPSILSFARARKGRLQLVELPRRVFDRPMPEVHLADMRTELNAGNRSIFSRALKQALTETVRAGEQAMLLMNHRGFHSFVSCRSCGKAVKCPNCDISMTYHLIGRNDGRLHCHYCGAAVPVPSVCPACGSPHIRYFGAGTQKVEDELKQLFPGVGVVRMDVDTTSGKDGHAKLLEIFRSGRAQLLVGTQMIAKGLDFPRVTLVGVMAADMSLNLPDYRAHERTFQLLTQVAGRAGRGEKPGRVIIQTYKPEDPVILAASRQDYRAFFNEELQRRRSGWYPPFSVLTRLLAESPSPDTARQTAAELGERVEALLAAHPEWDRRVLTRIVDQPGAKYLRGKHRWHVLLKLSASPEAEALCAALEDLARETRPDFAEVYFEYNPVTMI